MTLDWIKPTSERRNNFVVWKCKCHCGNAVYVTSVSKKQSCGCVPKRSRPAKPTYDLTGKVFGFTTALRYKQGIWTCRCACGNLHQTTTGNLNAGLVNSCGCGLARKRKGLSKTSEYQVWNAMMHRCYSENHPAYKNYGALGKTVTKRWHEFENFLEGCIVTGKQIGRAHV